MQTTTVPLIRSDTDFQEACDRLAEIASAPSGTEEHDEASVLWLVLEDYERRHHSPPLGAPPVEIVRWVMAKHGLTQADLIPVFRSAAAVSNFLAGRRKLSKSQIKGLVEAYNVSAFDLID